ncbi:hypothetical protein Tco_1005757 [Tanacetum coccineum]|uniref:Uncharacterized protein n=1 Tax=Tanacetum coccineum TaxID=301880 RepID=A0ABQ5FGV1_9ASTR
MKCLQLPEYAAAFGAVISLANDKCIKSGLVVGIDHGKSRRGLADIAAYDPFMEASIADIMNSLRLEGLSAKTLKTSLSESLNVVHDRVQKLKEGAISYRTSISDAMGALVDPLSSKNLIGEASTLEVPATTAATTTLSISVTAASASSIPPISVADYDVLDAGIQGEVPHSTMVICEKETLETTPERPTTS